MTHTLSTHWKSALAAAALIAAVGCGPRTYPVSGTVTLEDGKPLERGLVVFERVDGGPPVTARGDLQPGGQFRLSTVEPGDGAFAGRYKVFLNPLDTSDVPDEKKVLPFDVKYLNLKTTDLEVVVEARANEVPIKLSKPAGKAKPTQ